MTKRVDTSSRKAKNDSDRQASAHIGMLLLTTIKFVGMLSSTTPRVLDPSSRRIRITLPVNLRRGHLAEIIFRGVGELRAHNVWTHSGGVGIKFDNQGNQYDKI